MPTRENRPEHSFRLAVAQVPVSGDPRRRGAAVRAAMRAAAEHGARLRQLVGSVHPLRAPRRPQHRLYLVSDEGLLVTRDDYTAGAEPVVLDVDGFRFGFVLLSAYPDDPRSTDRTSRRRPADVS